MPRDLVLDHMLERWPDFAVARLAPCSMRAPTERSPAGVKIEHVADATVPSSPLGSKVALEIEPGPLAALDVGDRPSYGQCQVLSRVQFRPPAILS